jgi:FAD/FMN-containing dehydrogenase
MHRIKEIIDPDNLCNPGKIFPSPAQAKLLS